ncbi:MAG: hypothetical protein KJZ86_13090 [Caldilineaceae bacterium]|nr:hypothetical protein [Caldilineaceae bacterium]HRJ41413.1 hypothetical protein [Caldilineaceae bacterium]
MTILEPLTIVALAVVGLFSLGLGSVHFFFPKLLDFEHSIPKEGPPIRPFRLGPICYATLRSDVHGIGWVMNHAASYVLVSIGLFDLAAWWWLGSTAGRLLSLWIALWWLIRAASQFYLGRRRGDWWIGAGFALLALIQFAAAVL